MDWLYNLLDQSTAPALTAFLLGLLTAISPCPLATNIAAIGFIGKNIESRRRIFANGLLYTPGPHTRLHAAGHPPVGCAERRLQYVRHTKGRE